MVRGKSQRMRNGTYKKALGKEQVEVKKPGISNTADEQVSGKKTEVSFNIKIEI